MFTQKNILHFKEKGLCSNSYLLALPHAQTKDAVYFLIDPSHTPSLTEIQAYFPHFSFEKVKAIFTTHGHFDHLMALEEWKSLCPVPVYSHILGKHLFTNAKNNASALFGYPVTFPEADLHFKEKDCLHLVDDYALEILEVPGHSPDSCFLMLKKEERLLCIFSGDLIIEDSIGRYDLPLSDSTQLFNSLEKVMRTAKQEHWSEPVLFLAGHGRIRLWGEIFETHPFLNRYK